MGKEVGISHGDTMRLGEAPKVTELTGGRARLRTQIGGPWTFTLYQAIHFVA